VRFLAELARIVKESTPFPLPGIRPNLTFSCMSTVAEIESAIERLQPSEVAEIAAWLDAYQQMIQASAEMFAMYDREEP